MRAASQSTVVKNACLRALPAALWLTTVACSGQNTQIGTSTDAGSDGASSGGSSSGGGSGSSSGTSVDNGTGGPDAGCANTSCPVGSYLESCAGCAATASELSCAACAEGNGTSEPSSLSLPCAGDIANCAGQLSCGGCPCVSGSCPSGSYLQSCTGCSATSTELLCTTCKNGQGGTAGSSVSLPCSQGITNCQGQLTCGGC